MGEMSRKAWIIALIGFLAGASIGYFFRPTAIFVGQLPFDVVITRGGNLKGLEQMYLETAKTSFNYLFIGGIAGGIAGAIAGMKVTRDRSDKTN